ncbi:MAG: DUF565 domain-containing protein [Prochlorococcaceae cyanobacterium]
MSPTQRQNTRLSALLSRVGRLVAGGWAADWRSASLAMLALLLGFYLGQNVPMLVTSHIPGGRPTLVLAMVLLGELVIRWRSRSIEGQRPLGWVVVDNLRIGSLYAVVLEAFKLGT